MASLTSAAATITRFSGLKAGSAAPRATVPLAAASPKAAAGSSARASLKDVGAAVVATAASAVLASNALAVEVLLGGDDGSLAFVPKEIKVKPGDSIVFKNNAGFPHNVIFDEDEVPAGVDAGQISMGEEDLLNSAGEVFSVKLTAKGTYGIYCSPHQGAGMVGRVVVE